MLPALLVRYTRRFPNVRLVVRTGHSEEILDLALRREIDLGLVRELRHPDIESRPLYDDELVLVAGGSHRFGDRTTVGIHELEGARLILFDRTSSYYELTNAFFREAGVAPGGVMELDNIDSAKQMVGQGLGVALLPHTSVAAELADGRLRAIDIEGAAPIRRRIVAIRRRDIGPRSGPVAGFLDVLGEVDEVLPHDADDERPTDAGRPSRGFRLGQRWRSARRRVGRSARVTGCRCGSARPPSEPDEPAEPPDPSPSSGARLAVVVRCPPSDGAVVPPGSVDGCALAPARAGRRIRAGGRDDRDATGDEEAARDAGGEKRPAERSGRCRRPVVGSSGRWRRRRRARELVFPGHAASPCVLVVVWGSGRAVRPSTLDPGVRRDGSWEAVEPVRGETGTGQHQREAGGGEPLRDLLRLLARADSRAEALVDRR